MQSTLQQYENLQKKVDSLKSQVESMTQNMLENKILSPQTLEKYLELQKALQEINSPEFQGCTKKTATGNPIFKPGAGAAGDAEFPDERRAVSTKHRADIESDQACRDRTEI